VKILDIKKITHDVKCFQIEKPDGYLFQPGHATDVSINQKELEKELRPFTFTCLTREPYLEFTIKRYEDRHGITDRIHQLKTGDELIIRDSWGAIEFKGPGVFIAGGAGITPFVAILRTLKDENKTSGNRLFFSNKTAADIIYKEELTNLLGKDAVFLVSRETEGKIQQARINEDFLRKNIKDFHTNFYLCGPDAMVAEINSILQKLGASPESLVFEK
jgi:glycine betaine catabolism B